MPSSKFTHNGPVPREIELNESGLYKHFEYDMKGTDVVRCVRAPRTVCYAGPCVQTRFWWYARVVKGMPC